MGEIPEDVVSEPEISTHWSLEEETAIGEIMEASSLERIKAIHLYMRARKNLERALEWLEL
jgi:hypothetical protein